MQISSSGQAHSWIGRWNQLSRQFRKQIGERYAAAGLSESRAAVLQALLLPHPQLTQSDLASDLQLSESNLCSLIERMRSEGLVERRRSPLDRRKTVLSLTEAGRQRCHEIDEIHAAFEREIATRLHPASLRSLQQILQELDASLNVAVSGTLERKVA